MAASGVWVACYEDRSDLAIFSSELAAYRHANGKTMVVTSWPFGKTWAEVMAPVKADAKAAVVAK